MSRKSLPFTQLPTLVFAFAASAFAGVKVAGIDFVPKDLVFASPEAKSRATAEGSLPNECKWTLIGETRIARREDTQGKECIRYYYKTRVTLEQTCPAPNDKNAAVTRFSERITSTGPFCPDATGKVAPPNVEAHVLSSGTTPEEKHQDIVAYADGTRITLLYDAAGVQVVAVYPDGTADTLKLP